MKRLALIGSVLCLLGLIIILVVRRSRDEGHATAAANGQRPAPRPPAESGTGDRVADALQRPDAPVAIDLGPRPLPQSLQGTEIPGGLAADADGHLIVAPGIRVLFDYFLSATGEEPLDVIRARIISEIRRRLPPSAQEEAIALLDDYLEYRERARELYVAGASDNLDARLQQIRDIRRDVFGEKNADALFGEEEAVDYVTAAQAEIAKDASLPEDERLRRMEELNQQLPESARQAREEVLKPQRFFAEQEQLQARGASPQEVRELRERYWGSEAADRLEALDREMQDFQNRVDAFREERAEIESNSALNDEQRRQKIDELAKGHFTNEERLRVEALDEIEREKAAAAR